MPKSRGRKPRRAARARTGSGDPRRRQVADSGPPNLVERAAVELSAAVGGDLSDPLTLTSIPPLFLNMVVSAYIDTLPAGRCVDDCLVLAHAYAQMGMPAQVRTVEIAVADVVTGARDVHGSLRPLWGDGMFHGHTAVWLPDSGHLVDPTIEQYEEIAAYGDGPMIAGPGVARGESVPPGNGVRLDVDRGFLRLTYTLATHAVSAAALDHPHVLGEGDGYFLRGVNIASEVVAMLARSRLPQETAVIPNQRLVALVDAVRAMSEVRPENGFLYFQAEQDFAGPQRLDQIPLASGTPGPASVN